MKKYSVFISIVLYKNSLSELKKLFLNIHSNQSTYISVVDNSSNPLIKDFIDSKNINYIASENIGFGAGHNKNYKNFIVSGLSAKFILILNPDI